MANDPRWPALSAERDGPTIAALHLFSQVIGKVPTAVLPWRNHGWHLTLHVGPRGLATEPVHAATGTFTLALDLAGNQVVYEDMAGRSAASLASMSVADFHERVFDMLTAAGHDIVIHPAPNEIDPALPFAEDTAPRTYDPESARHLLGALISADRIFRLFRSAFLGKVSPVHFFWGSFDMAVTRFSGRRAPTHPGAPNIADFVTREAYSHECSSCGFWPGGPGLPEPAFYAYAYPAPEGFGSAPVRPAAAHFHQALSEFILPYEAVRRAADPDAELMEFLQSTYEAAADLGRWDRAALERPPRSTA